MSNRGFLNAGGARRAFQMKLAAADAPTADAPTADAPSSVSDMVTDYFGKNDPTKQLISGIINRRNQEVDTLRDHLHSSKYPTLSLIGLGASGYGGGKLYGLLVDALRNTKTNAGLKFGLGTGAALAGAGLLTNLTKGKGAMPEGIPAVWDDPTGLTPEVEKGYFSKLLSPNKQVSSL